MTVNSFYKTNYSSIQYQTAEVNDEERLLVWSLKRLNSLSYYKKEKVILDNGDKCKVKLEF